MGPRPVTGQGEVADEVADDPEDKVEDAHGEGEVGGEDRDGRSWLVVDVMNVVGSRPDGWWRDRTGAAAGLVRRLGLLADDTGERVTAVVDGSPDRRLPEGLVGGVEVHHAGRGRDAADDRIVALVAASGTPATVVTADRALADRVRARGGVVVGPTTLLARLPELPPPASDDRA